MSEEPRSFSFFVSQICDTELERTASSEMKKLLARLEEEAITREKSSGKLVITLKYDVDNKGNCDVSFNVERKEPKKLTGGGRCWLTKDSNYSMEPPGKRKSIQAVEQTTIPEPAKRAAKSV